VRDDEAKGAERGAAARSAVVTGRATEPVLISTMAVLGRRLVVVEEEDESED